MTDLHDWLSLCLVPGLGNVLMARLLAVYGEPAAVLRASPKDLRQVPGVGAKLAQAITHSDQKVAAERELEKANRENVTILACDDCRYPELLGHIYDPPAVLYVKGDVELLSSVCVAMVGSRAATVYGTRVANDMAKRLAAEGVTVVSGVALGVDAAAHTGALQSGRTIGVLGCGIDVVYPRQHQKLYEQIIENGALVSEAPFGARPEAFRFPARNRIISGLSQGIVVVEAAQRSGSLITARLALEQGREVFAIPGRIDSAKSSGAHRLLKEGATLVHTADDIFQELGFSSIQEGNLGREDEKRLGTALTLEEKKLYGWLDVYPQNIDELIQKAHMAPEKVAELLLLLELKGLIESLSGNQYQKVSSAETI